MKIDIGQSPYMEHANKEILWLPMDTEELYKSNLKEKRARLEQFNWVDSKFTYKFNSNGFRCQEFSDQPSVVFLGCSMTVGIGIPIESSWTTIVGNQLNLACYNLGIGGTSNDTAFRMAYAWLEKLKPKIVIFCQTYQHRLEGFLVKRYAATKESEYGEFENNWMTSEINGFLNKTKNRLAVEHLCNLHNIKFVPTTVEQIPYLDYGRDLFHPGIVSNKKFSETVLSLI